MFRIRVLLACVVMAALVAAVAVGTNVAGALQRPIGPVGGTHPINVLPPPTPQPPPPQTWRIQLFTMDQDTALPAGALTADRFWLQSQPVATTGGPTNAIAAHLPNPVSSETPAGSSGVYNGAFVFQPISMPADASMALRVHEDGVLGSTCRTRPVSSLPANDVPLHILVAPQMNETADDLNAMVSSFTGWQPTPPGQPKVYIHDATLTPQASSLLLDIKGLLVVNTNVFFFDYTLPLVLVPDNSMNVDHVVNVQQSGNPNLQMSWFGPPFAVGSPKLLQLVKASFEPQLHSTVLAQADSSANNSVLAQHDVRWWTEQGFTLSLRRVDYSTNGIAVHAALCRLN